MFDVELVDGASVLCITKDTIYAQPIARNQPLTNHAIVFDTQDGTFNLNESYDDYSLTSGFNSRDIPSFGIIGYIDFGFSTYICVITERKRVSVDIPNINIWRIKTVKMVRTRKNDFMTLDEEEQERICIDAIESNFVNGNCYYSLDLDLTNSFQKSSKLDISTLVNEDIFSSIDKKYVWNWNLIRPLFQEKYLPFIVPVICGYVGTTSIQSHSLLLRSRMSRFHTGARFFRRGINSNGECVMDVVTEMTFLDEKDIYSFCIYRGSAPVFWSQSSIEPFKWTLQMDLSSSESKASLSSSKRHFVNLEKEWGSTITCLDVSSSSFSTLSDIVKRNASFDYCQYMKRSKVYLYLQALHKKFLDKELLQVLEDQSFFTVKLQGNKISKEPKSLQKGIFRVHCLDCVDDTNAVQYILSKTVFQKMYTEVGIAKLDKKEWEAFDLLWMLNGDALSYQYTGTPSLNRSCQGFKLENICMSPYIRISRNYLNCFQDQKKQEYLNIFMGRHMDNFLEEENDYHPRLSSAILAIQDLHIKFRKAIVQREFSQKLYLSTLLFTRSFLSPTQITTFLQFIGAVCWLIIYMLYINIAGVEPNLLIRKTMSTSVILKE